MLRLLDGDSSSDMAWLAGCEVAQWRHWWRFHVNPLLLLRALNESFLKLGGRVVNGQTVHELSPDGGGFRLRVGDDIWYADKLILATAASPSALPMPVPWQTG